MANPGLANDLAIGKSAKVNGPIDISIVAPADFNFKPRAEIFRWRAQEIMKHPELLNGSYALTKAVFGSVEDKKPWWGIYGQGYYGPGQNSIKGPAEESRFILNPFLLVGEAMICGLDKSKVSEQDLINRKFPMFYSPSNLRWWPSQGRAEVTYEISAYKSQLAAMLGFSNWTVASNISFEAINARDLGLKYFYIPPSWAKNIEVGSPMIKPMALNQFVHCGNSCGYPGGCNNMSPRCEQLDNFRFTNLPARISIMFWKAPPTTGSEKPDMVYTMNYR